MRPFDFDSSSPNKEGCTIAVRLAGETASKARAIPPSTDPTIATPPDNPITDTIDNQRARRA